MRLLYVTDAITIWGGLERILVEKMNFFAEEYGYDVYLVTANQGSHDIPYPLSPKVHFCDLGIFTYLEYRYRGIKRLWVKHQLSSLFKNKLQDQISDICPDILLCVRLDLVSLLLKVKNHVPLVFEAHTLCHVYGDNGSRIYDKLKQFYYTRKVRGADMIVSLSEGDASHWKRINQNVQVIHNMVHLNPSDSYSDCMSHKAIFVGRFSVQKDIISLVKVWMLVNLRYPDWELHIYGGYGGDDSQLIPTIEDSKANIIMHEPTAQIFEAYRSSSMLLLTSIYEPFGLVMPEAMSCGLPVVAFDCPFGPKEIITSGVDGFLVQDRDIPTFADRVCQLIESPSLRVKMGKAAIMSSRRYEAHKIMPNWKNLFEQMIKQ